MQNTKPQTTPETTLPKEEFLWQGAPDWWHLATQALMLRRVAVFFAVLIVGRAATHSVYLGRADVTEALWLIAIGLMTCIAIAVIAWVQARSTTYTVTNRRIVLQIGVVMRVALNLPFNKISLADQKIQQDGVGDIALEPHGDSAFSYPMCWPHVRPMHFQTPQPALRCIREAERVAALIAQHTQAPIAASADARTNPLAQTHTAAFATLPRT